LALNQNANFFIQELFSLEIKPFEKFFDLPNESRLIHLKGSIDRTFTTLIWFEIEADKPSSICG